MTEERWVPEDSFAMRLVLLRRHLRLTQQEAAQLCDLDDGSWSNWENGTRPRGMDSVVRKIATATGVDPNWLMWGGPLSESLWIAPVIHSLDGQLDFHFDEPPSLAIV